MKPFTFKPDCSPFLPNSFIFYSKIIVLEHFFFYFVHELWNCLYLHLPNNTQISIIICVVANYLGHKLFWKDYVAFRMKFVMG